MNKKDSKFYFGIIGTISVIISSCAYGTFLQGNAHFHFIPTLIIFLFGIFILGYTIFREDM